MVDLSKIHFVDPKGSPLQVAYELVCAVPVGKLEEAIAALSEVGVAMTGLHLLNGTQEPTPGEHPIARRLMQGLEEDLKKPIKRAYKKKAKGSPLKGRKWPAPKGDRENSVLAILRSTGSGAKIADIANHAELAGMDKTSTERALFRLRKKGIVRLTNGVYHLTAA